MALAYTAPTWEDGSGTGISASQLQALSDCMQGLVQGLDKAMHSIVFNNGIATITYADGSIESNVPANMKGISSIAKTGTAGLVDTYTITFTDGTTFIYTVTNGRVGQDGRDGAIQYTAGPGINISEDNEISLDGDVSDFYAITDATDTSLANDDAFPFLKDGETPTKKKITWSNIVTALKSVFIRDVSLVDIVDGIKNYVVLRKEYGTSAYSQYQIPGSYYLESSSGSTSAGTTTFTFTDSYISSNGVYDYYCDVYGVAPKEIRFSGTTMYVDFNSSDSVTKCRVYIR